MIRITIEDVRASADRLLSTVEELDEEALREPSALPNWTRADVLDHLTGAAHAYIRLLALARGTEQPPPRPDGLRASLDQLLTDAAAMPAESWETTVTALAGWRHPAWFTLNRCQRELETHHLDLDLGYALADWPAGYVRWALTDTIASLTARSFPVAKLTATDLNQSWPLSPTGPAVVAPAPTLLAWLAGRTPLSTTDPLPTPPPWPLPPTPGWG
ncbi:maleylpyruvate isomerase family mycothiol-dependent enzyme [Streptacidiphilus neutrinimicus]|uniref:maleylpyruvate isomerase family mycothiol-dependent enzyme n=1 Tax=Streptacidiphilus neutrinimicus TaxID=105420 RepID=UPI0005A86D7E|nr:maleylpyruvate isomerase family mycothiol-dependent enzyme [Streptacidiphilus neutrinimicus]